MGKFFFKPSDINSHGTTISLTGNSAHHMIHVLRMHIGQEITLCDGNGIDFHAKLESISIKPVAVTFTILSQAHSSTESSTPIILFQGLPKGDKMDWIIEKAVEAGVNKIIPVYTARTVIKEKDSTKKSERYARISESAASQSMRGIIPEVTNPMRFSDALLESAVSSLCLIAYEKEYSRTIKDIHCYTSPKPISLWIGPEGGFEDSEVGALKDIGAIPISLGPRVLRTETAGLIALAQILFHWS